MSIESKGQDWRHSAKCQDEDPELFFPIGNTGPAALQIEDARAVCNRCLVIDKCLKFALENGEDAGVWGGMSEDERGALKRRQQRAKRPKHDPIMKSKEDTTYEGDGQF